MRTRWLTIGCLVALVAATGCRRVERSGPGGSPSSELRPDERLSPKPARQRPSAAAPAPSPAPSTKKATKGQPPPVKPNPPTPYRLIKAGEPPRITLLYRFSNEEKLVWRSRMEQLTHVRKEKRCPARAQTPLRGPTVKTIPVRYGVDLTTTVSRATDGLYQLDTRMTNVSMTLPGALANQQKLLLNVLSNVNYSRRMNNRGQVTRFSFGKLTPRTLVNLSERLKAPLSHLQPMLPAAPVGVGAVWQHNRTFPLRQPGGSIAATYLTQYRLTAIRRQGDVQVVDLEMTTMVKMVGKLMGNDFTGSGSGTSKITLDAVRGVIRLAKGNLSICSSVKDRTSTNRTTFSQKLLSGGTAKPPPAKGTVPKRPAPMGTAPMGPTPKRLAPKRPAPKRPAPRPATMRP